MSALFFPGLMVMLFSRVTFNQIVALSLTVALIAVSVYKGYTNSWLLIVIDAFSLTAGFWLSNNFIKKNKNSA
nr:CsbA family protein [Peribacillus deserti]